MFSADITWTPVAEAEVGSRRKDRKTVPSSPPSEPGTDRVDILSRDGESVRSSGSRKLSVFGWSRRKRSSASNSGDRPRQASSINSSGVSKSKYVDESVAEMPEDRGPERHELPAGVMLPRRSPTLEYATWALPLAGEQFTGSFAPQSPTRYYSPGSIHGNEGIASPWERSQPIPALGNTEREIASDGGSWGNWGPHEESVSSSRGSAVLTDHHSESPSSPRTTIISQSRNSVLDGLSPPPRSPHRPKPPANIADPWSPSSPGPESQSRQIQGIQALTRRMTRASASTRWNRAREKWIEPLDAGSRQEINLEKDIWLVSELLLRDTTLAASPLPVRTSLGPTLPVHAVQRSGRILDVASRPADLYHLAALQPAARIAHLAPIADKGETALWNTHLLPLPYNVASLSLVPTQGSQGVAFPLGDASCEHVRATPAAVGAFSSHQLKALLRECHRVLAVRGLLEIRLLDPKPRDAGPAVARWVESELLVALESEFRCTRPAVMVPLWACEAGLECMDLGEGFQDGVHEFRVCVEDGAAAEEQLEAELCRSLLRSQYPFVKAWLWEIHDCRVECLELRTRFRVMSLFGLKT
ncbi:hypothetical protein B0T25DRAFT_541298 [Lasiosphaeria hispida]|uniref:Uncharacterized protein n=1 Tax=Lasiosphaeria hispida TaxID=260671 RepID=A0AAJ0HGG0_9PEZI|nr:hypothetical protein B0T25DRAFT_541298 [Lasiosphaeria hispida]